MRYLKKSIDDIWISWFRPQNFCRSNQFKIKMPRPYFQYFISIPIYLNKNYIILLRFTTGLDPAGPGFEYGSLELSYLNKDVAVFVDVIHTASGTFGNLKPIGHVDFYPNRGISPQPGCLESYLPNAMYESSKLIRFLKCDLS